MVKKYNQKPTIKLSKDFKNNLMKLKYDLGCKDIEELIQRMYDIITKFKLAKELKNMKLKSMKGGNTNKK